MQKIIFNIALTLLTLNSYAQTKNFIDQPFIEINVEVDSLVVPDQAYLRIVLNESDDRDKITTEEKERVMVKVLKALDIDTEKDLSLLDLSSDFKRHFLSKKKILKVKVFSLKVKDAFIASKVFVELEKINIPIVLVDKIKYSKEKELVLALKSKAILVAKKEAESLLTPLHQKVGAAIFISDLESFSNGYERNSGQGLRIRGASSIKNEGEPIFVEFNKIKFKTSISVKFKIE